MGKQRKIRFGAGFLLLLVVCFLAFTRSQPRYKGRTVFELSRLVGDPHTPKNATEFFSQRAWGIKDEDARDALIGLRVLGPEAEQALIRQMQARDRIWHRTYETIRLRLPLSAQHLFPPLANATYRRQMAVTVIGKLGALSAQTEHALLVACHDPDPIVRERATLILGYRGSRSLETLQAVADAMRDPQLAMRVSERGPALAGFNFKANSVEEMIWDLSCPFPEVRYQAASALRDFGSNAEPAVPALTRACVDSNELVRVASAKALGSIGVRAATALAILRTMVNDENSFARSAATQSIEEIQKAIKK